VSELLVPGPAAGLYALAIAIDTAADSPLPGDDVSTLIEQGQAWVRHIEAVPAGLGTVYWRDAAAMFCRAWARHCEPDAARDLLLAAEDLEAARDMHLATMPRPDA
jgi:hypothetical protein